MIFIMYSTIAMDRERDKAGQLRIAQKRKYLSKLCNGECFNIERSSRMNWSNRKRIAQAYELSVYSTHVIARP